MLFVRLFGLCLFRFVGFLFLLGLGRAAVCDCGTPWTFLLPFLQCKELLRKTKVGKKNSVRIFSLLRIITCTVTKKKQMK